MNSRNLRRMIILALAWTLSVGAHFPQAYADGSSPGITLEVAEQASLGSVSISDNSSIEIKEASVLAADDGNLAVFTLSLHNGENEEIQWIDYWVRLMDRSGTSYTVQVLPQDKDKNRVAPYSTQDIRLYAKVSGSTGLQDLIFRVVRWDFSIPGYERSLGERSVPDDYSEVTPSGSARIVKVSGVDVKMAPERMDAGNHSEFYLPRILFRMENIGVKAAELPAYQFTLRTQEGLQYPLEVKGLEDNSRSLYPRFTKELELKGKLPISVGPEGWELIITVQSDANGGKLTLPAAAFALPRPAEAADETETPVDEAKTIEIGNQTLETRVTKVNRTKLDSSINVALTYGMKNTGTGSITLPAYRFAIQTPEGLTYPVKADGVKDLVIDPLFGKEAQLTVSIPSSVSSSGWKLLLLPPVDASTGIASEAALAVYQLSDSSSGQGTVGTGYEFTSRNGTYRTVLNAIQRLPWEDQDILSANLTISNKGMAPLPVPAFTGYFLLDQVVRVPAEAILKDNVISVKPGGELRLQLYGKIPYTNEYSSIKLVLQEKGMDGAAAADLLEFRSDSQIAPIPVVPANGSYRTEGIGRQAGLTVRDVRTFTDADADADLFSVQVSVQNLEKRYTGTGSLVAYLKTQDDTMYPAAVSEADRKISPGGAAMLNVSAYLPKTLRTADLKLILGAGVKEGRLVQTGEPDAYIDAVTFTLPTEAEEPKTNLRELDLFPYIFSVSEIDITTYMDHMDLHVDYKLAKNGLADMNMEEHKLVVEYEDKDNEIRFSKTFSFGKEGGDSLQVGEHDFLLRSPTDSSFRAKLTKFDKYKLRVYHEFKGQRKLIAEKTVDFFGGYTY